MQSTMSASAPLQIQSVVDQVYDAVRARILSGELPRGSRLRQAALAHELGEFADAATGGAARLATEGGRVRGQPRRSPWPITTSQTSARHGSPASRSSPAPRGWRPSATTRKGDLSDARRNRGAAGSRGDPSESYDVNREFHLALVAGAGNAYLSRFAEMLWAPQLGVLIYAMQADDLVQVLSWADEHEQIVNAVEAATPIWPSDWRASTCARGPGRARVTDVRRVPFDDPLVVGDDRGWRPSCSTCTTGCQGQAVCLRPRSSNHRPACSSSPRSTTRRRRAAGTAASTTRPPRCAACSSTRRCADTGSAARARPN